MNAVAIGLLMFGGMIASSGLAMMHVMDDGNLQSIGTKTLLKVWGICLGFAITMAIAAHFITSRSL